MGTVKNEKTNLTTGKITKKTIIIVDSQKSKTASASRRIHKSNLPRVTGAAKGALGLLRDPVTGECADLNGVELWFLIADVTDAFWLVPLRKSGCRYVVIKFRGLFYVFLRTAQGSRGAPLSWSVIVSLLARVVQSLFCSKGTQTARLQVYVDDPLLALRGTANQRRNIAVTSLLKGSVSQKCDKDWQHSCGRAETCHCFNS